MNKEINNFSWIWYFDYQLDEFLEKPDYNIEFHIRQQELAYRFKIWQLLKNILDLEHEVKYDEDYYLLILNFWKSIVDLWIWISVCMVDKSVNHILWNQDKYRKNISSNSETVNFIFYNLWEKYLFERSILNQSISTIKDWYNILLWSDIEQLWNKIIECVNLIKESELILKEKLA